MRRREGSCYFKVLFLETNIASRVTTNSTLGDAYSCIYWNWSQTVWRDWRTVSTHTGVDNYISHNNFTKKMKSLLISNKSCTGYTNFFYFKYIKNVTLSIQIYEHWITVKQTSSLYIVSRVVDKYPVFITMKFYIS